MTKVLLLSLILSSQLFAHDEGHGPKLTDAPKNGGVVTSVVLAKDANLGAKAALQYKAELVRTADGLVRLYFFDAAMRPVALEKFSATAKALVLTVKKGKVSSQPFELARHGDHYMGTSPKPAKKPYSIDVKFQDASRELLAAFDNLD